MILSYSALAAVVDDVLDPALGKRRSCWGLCIHTTGGGVPAKARRTGERPITVALEVYRAMQRGSQGYLFGGPTYVIDYDGTIYQLSPDEVMTAHCGHPHRATYLHGDWEAQCSPATVQHWHKAWPSFPNPQTLFPGQTPNEPYVGVEMVPTQEPRAGGLRFTAEQHEAVVKLARDLAERHGWPEHWAQGPRLLGHEDVNPLDRHDLGGGWDPGWLRDEPYFDLGLVRRAI